MDQDDPADWSIDRVIQEICHEVAPNWRTGTKLKAVINPEVVAKALRDNDIDGDNLLALEDSNVRNDLNITSFGQRRTFTSIIEHLRSLSPKYQEQLSRKSVAAWATPQLSHISADSHARSPSYAGSTVQQTIETGKRSNDTPIRVVDAHPSAQEGSNPRKRRLEDLDDAAHVDEFVQSQRISGSRLAFANDESTNIEKVQVRENSVGQPRILSRSLNSASDSIRDNQVGRDQSILNSLDTAIDSELDTGKDATLRSEAPKEIRNTTSTFHALEKKTPKRATLIHVADKAGSTENTGKLPSADDIDWMPDVVISDGQVLAQNTGTLFSQSAKRQKLHSNTALGEEPALRSQNVFAKRIRRRANRADQLVQPKSHKSSTVKGHNQVDESSTFLILGSKSSTFRTPRAARQVQPLYVGRSQLAPTQSATNQVVQANTSNEDPQQQAVVSYWAQAKPDFDLTPELLDLLSRHPAIETDHVFPSYGESDEEDRMWTPEPETPPPDDRRQQNVLSKDEIDLIINETLEKFRADWQIRHLPKIQMKARQKWLLAAENKAMHGSTIREFVALQGRASARIQYLRRGIHLSEWRKAEDVKQQCDAIEVSVHQLQEYEHYLEVLRCESEPLVPPQAALTRLRQSRRRKIMDNGDEDLASDSGNSFVVSDNDEDTFFLAEEEQQDPERPAWNPKFAEKHQQTDRAQSIGTLYQAGREDSVVDSVEQQLTPIRSQRNLTSPHAVHDVDGNKLVDEQVIGSSSTKHDKSAKHQAAIESAKRNPMSLPFLTDSEDDSDSERRPSLPQTKFRKHGKSSNKAIDLTRSSSPSRSERQGSLRSELEIRTPRLSGSNTPAMGTFLHKSNRNSSSVDPIVASASTQSKSKMKENYLNVKWVLQKEWEDIESKDMDNVRDTLLVLAKSVYGLSLRRSQRILDYLGSFRDGADFTEILCSGLLAEKEYEELIDDVEQKNQENARDLTHLFIVHATGFRIDSENDITEEQVDKAYDTLTAGLPDFQPLLKKLLQHHVEYHSSSRPSNLTVNDDTTSNTDSDIEFVASSIKTEKPARKGRQRRVIQSQDVVLQQRLDQNRVESQEARRQAILKKQSALGIAQDKLSIAISASEPLVYLDPRLAACVKPHQIDGIRFMWREIIEDPRSQGCLLAHTMGLGKTLQVISVLASIAQCNKSSNPLNRELIPQHLRRLRIMVICPRGLIENWFEELSNWLPDTMMLGVLIKFDNFIRQPETTIKKWYDDGGVLIISYERFRKFVVSPTNALLTPQQLDDRRRHLTEGPDIVIADEAHRLKNAKSKLNVAAQQIVTKSRIAMTGSPLNNHLEEYHTMIEWIAPGYLGSPVQFRAKYVEPIHQGLYNESSAWERKASMKKLHVLKRILAPKIHRADITAISKDLPPKTEFFLTITLTNEQKKAYQLYIEILRASATGKLGNTRLWDWLSLLSLLLNHPSCFIRKIRERENTKAAPAPDHPHRAESSDDDNDNIAPASSAEVLDMKDQPALVNAMHRVKQLFAEAQLPFGLEDPALSHKTLLVKLIIEEAVKHKEKTLIFSQSILTLDYYEAMLKAMGMDFKRIDGSKGSTKNRQGEVAQFNQSQSAAVFLISTRAGGLGLNIQSASRVIINDFNFNPSWEEQAIGRAYRMGQTKPVFVYRFLVGGTFEELVHNRAVFKTQLFTRVVDEQNVKSQAAKKPGEFLFDPKDVPQKDFGDCIGKDPNVLDRVLTKVDCIRNIFLTETFFQEDDEDLNEQELKEADEELAMERLERENPAEYSRIRLMMDQRAAQERTRLSKNTISQQMPNVPAPDVQPGLGVPYGHSHFVDLRGAIQSGMISPSAAWSTIPSLQMLPQFRNNSSSFSDENVPSTRFTTQPTRLAPRAVDDQIVYDAPRPTPYVAANPTFKPGTANAQVSLHSEPSNNVQMAVASLLGDPVAGGTNIEKVNKQPSVDTHKNSFSSTANNPGPSKQFGRKDSGGKKDVAKSDAPSGCRPQ